MLDFLLTYAIFALPECKAQSPLNQTNTQQQVVLSLSPLQQAMTKPSKEATVEINFVDIGFRKSPMTKLLMDVTLHNHYNQPYWFLLPADIGSSMPQQNGVSDVEVLKLGGKGRVVLSLFVGSANYQAFLLPAGAKLKIRRLPITLWEENFLDKEQVEVEVVIASQVTINGEPAQAWFGSNSMSDIEADVTADESQRIGSRSTGNAKEVPISVFDKKRFKVVVPL